MGSDVDGEILGAELKGYTLRITGGNDKQGFTMKQGVLVNGRVRILLRQRTTLYRPRRTGERKRKSVRGCITGPDLSVIALKVLEKGPGEVTGLTDAERPRRLGPKRAAHIRTAFALRKKDNVCKYVVRRAIERNDKTRYKSPSVQRLITDKRLRRKSLMKRNKKNMAKATKEAHSRYEKLLSKFLKEKKAAAKKTVDTPTPAPAKVAPAKTAKPVAKKEEKKAAAPVKTAPAKVAEAKPAKKAETKKGGKK